MGTGISRHSGEPAPYRGNFTVETRHGCHIVMGTITMAAFETLGKGLSQRAVADLDLASLMGAALVVGEPENMRRLRADRASLPISASRRQDAAAAQALHLPPAVTTWLLHGFRNPCADAICQAIFGVPEGADRIEHPRHSRDLAYCMDFLSATGLLESAALVDVMSARSPQWAALMQHWEALINSHFDDMERKKGDGQASDRLIRSILGNVVAAAAKDY